MPPFVFQAPPQSFARTIGEMMQQEAAIRAQQATENARIQAQADQTGSAAWAHAVQGIGSIAGNTLGQIMQNQADEPKRQLQAAQLQIAQGQLADQQRSQQARQLYSQAMQANADPTMQPQGPSLDTPNGVVPQFPNLLVKDASGVALYDPDAIAQFMTSRGMADQVPKIVKDFVAPINDVHLETAKARQALQDAQQEGLSKVAGKLYQAIKQNPESASALVQMAGEQFAANGTAPGTVQAFMSQLQGDPATILSRLKYLASQGKAQPVKLGDGDQLLDPYTNEPMATNPKPPPQPTRASLAADAANPQSPTAAASQAALSKMDASKSPSSLEQQLLEAKVAGDQGKVDLITGTMKAAAMAKRDPEAMAQIEALRNLNVEQARQRLEDGNAQSPRSQAKFETEYRNVLTRTLSSRSGGFGNEDGKVNQAIHLLAVFDQNKDPKTGEYTIPKMMQGELALGLARLISPTGVPSEKVFNELNQKTAAGDIAGAVTYLTGKPVTGNTQAVFQALRDSIERQGNVAEQNREGYLDEMRGLAPTDLNEDRRKQVEAALLKLNSVKKPAVTANKMKDGTEGTVGGVPAVWKTVNGKTGWYAK